MTLFPCRFLAFTMNYWILLALFLILIVLILVFVGTALRVMRKNDLKATSAFFGRFLLGFLALMFTLFFAFGVISAVYFLGQGGSAPLLAVLSFLRVSFETILFFGVFRWMRILLRHLEKEEIFLMENAQCVRKSGNAFLYLGLIEIVGGLVTGALVFFLQITAVAEFMVTMNLTVLLYLVIGFLLLLVGHLLDKAIAIYEENRLTI